MISTDQPATPIPQSVKAKWDGLAGGIMILLAIGNSAWQSAAAYQIARRPWLADSARHFFVEFGVGLIWSAPIILLAGLSATIAAMVWAIYRRKAADAISLFVALLLWLILFWGGVPGYFGQAGVLRLVGDNRFNATLAAEMARLLQQRSKFTGHVLPTGGQLKIEFPLLATIHPTDAWYGRDSVYVIFGYRQMYVFRSHPHIGHAADRSSDDSVLYYRDSEDGPLLLANLSRNHGQRGSR